MRIVKTVFKLLGILLLVSVIGTLYVLNRGGAFREIKPHFAGRCDSLPLDGSAEDITVDRERGFAYISYMDRAALIRGEAVQGTIMRIDLNRVPLVPEDALLDRPAHLRTHGLSLYISPEGKRSLFVINHPVNRGTEPSLSRFSTKSHPASSGIAKRFRVRCSTRRTIWPQSARGSSMLPMTKC